MSAELHLDDAALVAILDGEDVGSTRTHLDGCAGCSSRLEVLREREVAIQAFMDPWREDTASEAWPTYDAAFLARMGEGVRAARDPAPARHSMWRTPSLRWAAVIVLVAGALAAPPVRAFLAASGAAVWQAVTGASAADPARTVEPEAGATEVGATIDGPMLSVIFDDDDAFGEVRFSRVDGPTATARMVGGSGAEILVGRDGFRVSGGSTGGVQVEIGVPDGVVEVAVRVAGRERARRPAPSDSTITVRFD